MMADFSEFCELTLNENRKRCLRATVDITPGDVILQEDPLIVAANWESENMYCSNCVKESVIMCQKCFVFPMCIECKEHDEFDCKFFQRGKNISKDLLVRNYSVYGALKYLLGLESATNISHGLRELLESDAHLDDYKNSELWQEQKSKIIKPLLESGISEYCHNIAVSESLLERICSIINLNAFDVINKEGDTVTAIYLRAAQIPHSCIPNTSVSVDSDFKLKVFATLPIQQGSFVYSSYANLLMGTSQRQHYLKITKYINCSCPRCEDPTELGTYLSSLKCRNCAEGYVSHINSEWICDKCASVVDGEDVNKLLASIAEKMYHTNGDIRQYEKLLAKYSSRLHKNHFLIIDIKQNIASILRAILMNPMYQPEKHILKQQIKLCEDILPVARAVQPGISKLYAIALYEFVIAFVELAENEYNDNEITIEEFKGKLLKAENICKEAVPNLEHEFENSPEGQLSQRIKIELQRIADNLITLTLE